MIDNCPGLWMCGTLRGFPLEGEDGGWRMEVRPVPRWQSVVPADIVACGQCRAVQWPGHRTCYQCYPGPFIVSPQPPAEQRTLTHHLYLDHSAVLTSILQKRCVCSFPFERTAMTFTFSEGRPALAAFSKYFAIKSKRKLYSSPFSGFSSLKVSMSKFLNS